MIYTLRIGRNNDIYRGRLLIVDDDLDTVCAVETWCEMVGLSYKRNSFEGVNRLVNNMKNCLKDGDRILLDHHLGLTDNEGREITGLAIVCKYFTDSDLEKIVIVTSDPGEAEIESQNCRKHHDKIMIKAKTSLCNLLKEYFCIG